MNCLELTRTDAVFSRIAFGVFCLCRVQKFTENSRKIRKSIFEGKEPRSQKTTRGGTPGAGAGPTCGWGPGRPCPWDLTSRPPFAYKLPFDLKTRAPEHFFQKPYGALPPSRNLNSGSRIAVPTPCPSGDRRHRHRQRLSINHPCRPPPCVSSSLL